MFENVCFSFGDACNVWEKETKKNRFDKNKHGSLTSFELAQGEP